MVEEVLVAARHGPEDETEVVEGQIRLPNGEEIARRFLKGKLLGKGGFAKCYLATCLDSDEAYALKVVSKSSLQKSSARQRQLKTEVRVHRMLNHKHVVRFEHSFETEHYVYILLELCPNKSMVELLKRRTRLEECEVRYYLLQLVAAVRHMHARGIIHRDLKLGNIFLDQDMQCKVGDLGLAAKCGKSERKQTMCGTPNYIAPEILDATGHSFQVDLWSLGVVAYTLLVGRPPYECKDIRSTYKRILANSYAFPPTVPLSEHARHFVRSLLQTKPENRPTLDQVESLPFLARAKPHLPPSLPLSALHSPPPSDWLVIPRTTKPKSSSTSPISPPGPLATTRRPLGLRDSNALPLSRPAIKIHADPPGKKPASKLAVDTAGSVRSVRGRTPPLAQQENIPPPSKTSTAAPRILKSIPSASSSLAPHRSPPLPRPRASPPTPLSATTTRPRPISNSPATTNSAATSASLRSRASPSPASTPTIRTDTLPKRRTPVLSPPQDDRPAFKVSPSTRSRGESASPPTKPSLRSPALKPLASTSGPSTRKPLSTVSDKLSDKMSDKPDERVRRRTPTEVGKAKDTTPTTEPPVLRRRAVVVEEQTPPRAQARAEQKERSKESRATSETREREAREETRDRTEIRERIEIRDRAELKERVEARHTRNPPPARGVADVVDPLELIHRRLTRFLNEAEEQRANRPSSRPTRPLKSLPPSLEQIVPKVWIERYCDFSTKYGIGFLLNNGSAGVHFNDSTKIVVDAQGHNATYTERYTRQRTPDKGPSPKTHHVSRFTMDDYPEELHKKVTLLQHFRKFLLQGGGVKGSSVPSSASEKETADPLEGDDASGPVYVRKWARTSLALVFRLSSRVLQIMFEHGEEVLITEDARVLTHVDGLGVRTSYSLNAMLEAPSSGIVKRLQFANRLIEELRRT